VDRGMPCMLYSTMFSRDPQASVILAGGRCFWHTRTLCVCVK
jgi:hypothetical protein